MPIPRRPLSKRQHDVVALIAEGMTNLRIARSLSTDDNLITEEAVKQTVKLIAAKFGADNRAGIVHEAYQSGMMSCFSSARWWLNIREWDADAEYIVCRQCHRELGYPESDVSLQDDGQVWCSFCAQTWWPTWISRVPLEP